MNTEQDKRMTAEEFNKWLADMSAAGHKTGDRAIARMLGVHYNSVGHWQREGTKQRQTDLACAALLAGLAPYGSSSLQPDGEA